MARSNAAAKGRKKTFTTLSFFGNNELTAFEQETCRHHQGREEERERGKKEAAAQALGLKGLKKRGGLILDNTYISSTVVAVAV